MSKRMKKIIITLGTVLVLLLLILPFTITLMIYRDNFGERYESYEPMSRSITEFEGVNAQRYTFPSNKGQQLVGYKYYYDTEDAKGIVVIAHGLGGGGHNSYIDVANYFASNGYLVFAYDATGFNKSTDIIKEEGKRITGNFINVLMPYISTYERIKFGKYATYSCLKGFENSEAGVMILSSEEDQMISLDLSYNVFYDVFRDNPRFHFIKYEDRGHNNIYYSDISRQYSDDFNKEFSEYVDSLEGELTPDIKAAYLKEHLNKSMLYNFDYKLMDRIIAFYDSHVGKADEIYILHL